MLSARAAGNGRDGAGAAPFLHGHFPHHGRGMDGDAGVAARRRHGPRAARGGRSPGGARRLPGRSPGPQPGRRRPRARLLACAGRGAGQADRRPAGCRATGRGQRAGPRLGPGGRLRLPPGRGRVLDHRCADLRHHPDRALRPGRGRRPRHRARLAGVADAAPEAGALAGDRRRQRAAAGRPVQGGRGARGAGPRDRTRLPPRPADRFGGRTGRGRRDMARRRRRDLAPVLPLQPADAADRQAVPRGRRLGRRLDLRGSRPGADALVERRSQAAAGHGGRCRRRRRCAGGALREGPRADRRAGPLRGPLHRPGGCPRLHAAVGLAAVAGGGAGHRAQARERRHGRARAAARHRPDRVAPRRRRRVARARRRGRAVDLRRPLTMEDTDRAALATFLGRLQWGLLALLACWVLWLLAPVLTPFVLAALLGWLGDPLVDRMQARGVPRNGAVIMVFAVMAAVTLLAVLLLVPMLQRQVVTLVTSLPNYREWFVGTALPWLEARTGLELVPYLDPARLFTLAREHWEQAGGAAATMLGYLSRSGFAVLGWVANVVLLPVLTFFFLRDWDLFVSRFAALVPRDKAPTVARLARESSEVLGGFLRGQLLVMLILGVLYAI